MVYHSPIFTGTEDGQLFEPQSFGSIMYYSKFYIYNGLKGSEACEVHKACATSEVGEVSDQLEYKKSRKEDK